MKSVDEGSEPLSVRTDIQLSAVTLDDRVPSSGRACIRGD